MSFAQATGARLVPSSETFIDLRLRLAASSSRFHRGTPLVVRSRHLQHRSSHRRATKPTAEWTSSMIHIPDSGTSMPSVSVGRQLHAHLGRPVVLKTLSRTMRTRLGTGPGSALTKSGLRPPYSASTGAVTGGGTNGYGSMTGGADHALEAENACRCVRYSVLGIACTSPPRRSVVIARGSSTC